MRRKAVLIAATLTASLVGAFAGVDLSRASRPEACDAQSGRALTPAAAARHGGGIPAVVGGRSLVVVDGQGRRETFLPRVAGPEVVRDAAARPGSGIAFVLDRRGPDDVVIEAGGDELRLAQPGEASDPSWSSDGQLVWSLGSRLRLWSPATSFTAGVAPPPGAIGVFSPVFATDDAIVAVVAEPEPGFSRTEDEGLDNLWRYDLSSGRWSRATAFHASGDRWVAVRTPIVRDDGSVEFVVVRGLATATRMPAFELWRLPPGGDASKVRDLPREMYLAGTQDGRRIWNLYDEASGEWRLYAEASTSTLVDLGCGAALVDPRSVPDPDMTPARLDTVPTPSPTPTVTPTPSPTASPTPSQTPTPTAEPTTGPSPTEGSIAGILVGDFATLQDANTAVAGIDAAYGQDTPVEVVDSQTAPNIVRPGVWAAVMLLPAGVDPLAALTDFRTRLPQYQGWSWVVAV